MVNWDTTVGLADAYRLGSCTVRTKLTPRLAVCHKTINIHSAVPTVMLQRNIAPWTISFLMNQLSHLHEKWTIV